MAPIPAQIAGDCAAHIVRQRKEITGWHNLGDRLQSSDPVPPAPGLDRVVAIAAGGVEENGEHRLALKSDGTVIAWGDNRQQGQSKAPVGLSGVIAIAVDWKSGDIIFASGATINSGVFIVQADNLLVNGGGAPLQVTNTGLFQKTGPHAS